MAHGFIEELESGYETVVGQRGITLSGGQRQRIAIARALLADPKIVVLDDSLSSVDTKTEKEIRSATKALLEDRTTILVTQRLSSLSAADLIVVMDEGRIVETGSHDTLVAAGGVYQRLTEAQRDGLIDLELIQGLRAETPTQRT